MRMRMGDAGELAMFLAIGSVLVTVLVGPIGQAIGRRISRGKGGDPELESERGQLEERLEFAERLLTRGDDARASGLKADG